MTASRTVIMVHGAFCGGWVFDDFRRSFEAAGFRVLAPDLRGHGPGDPPGNVAGLSMADYAADIAALCQEAVAQDGAAPILLGHSMGGLVAQMTARRAPVSMLVLMAPSAPWGVFGGSLEEAVTAAALPLVAPTPFSPLEPDLRLLRAFSLDRLSPPDQPGPKLQSSRRASCNGDSHDSDRARAPRPGHHSWDSRGCQGPLSGRRIPS